jgi:hypothetical protein
MSSGLADSTDLRKFTATATPISIGLYTNTHGVNEPSRRPAAVAAVDAWHHLRKHIRPETVRGKPVHSAVQSAVDLGGWHASLQLRVLTSSARCFHARRAIFDPPQKRDSYR